LRILSWLTWVLILVCVGCSERKGSPSSPADVVLKTKTPTKIDQLMDQMTLEEKVGQLSLPSAGLATTGPVVTSQSTLEADTKAGRVGGIFNAFTVDFTTHMQKLAVENTRLGIPLIFGFDVIHGYRTIFPVPLAEASSWDLDAIHKSARTMSAEAASGGLHWTFDPMVDIALEPRWGRVVEGAGEDPYLGSLIAAARVVGIQGRSGGNTLLNTDELFATAKHFAGYGAVEGGREYNTVDMSDIKMHEFYLRPFKAAVDAGVASVMTAFNTWNFMPATASRRLVHDILRQEWKFRGFVTSDYTGINELEQHGIAAELLSTAFKSITVGVDFDMQGGTFLLLPDLVREIEKIKNLEGEAFLTALEAAIPLSLFDESRSESAEVKADWVARFKALKDDIDDSVRRVLNAKQLLGLFDDPYRFSNADREKENVFSAENRAAALDVARRSMVLLKNGDPSASIAPVLPLSKDVGTIAIIGPLGTDKTNLIGSWSGFGDATEAESLYDGIKAKLPNAKILTAKGTDIQEDTIEKENYNLNQEIPRAVAVAEQADVVIAALGESADMTGEAASRSMIGLPNYRSDLSLPGHQDLLLSKLYKTGKPIVLVLMNGRPLTLVETSRNASAILEAWFLGTRAGTAIADVLFGDYNPSGRLPISFPRRAGVPVYYNQLPTGRPYTAGDPNKYLSKYIDVPNSAFYPFGFGLSYTTFTYDPNSFSITTDDGSAGFKSASVSVTVSNTGNVPGKETVQLYIRDEVARISRPVRQLKGFRQISLEPGKSQTVVFQLTRQDLSFFAPVRDGSIKEIFEPGYFSVWVGSDSTATLGGRFRARR
jgi:beta-glucosidase